MDSATGATHSLEVGEGKKKSTFNDIKQATSPPPPTQTSGLVPKYCQKQEYGKVPSYLEQRKREMAEAQEEYDRYVAESLQRGQMEKVQQEERCLLLCIIKL